MPGIEGSGIQGNNLTVESIIGNNLVFRSKGKIEFRGALMLLCAL